MIYVRKIMKTAEKTRERDNFLKQEINVKINIEKDIRRNILRDNVGLNTSERSAAACYASLLFFATDCVQGEF
jgi:hypothetical protein